MLDLKLDVGGDANVHFSDAVREWVGARWPRGREWFRLDEPDSLQLDDKSIFRWEPFITDGKALIDFTWRHPHVDAPHITWSTRAAFFTTDTGTRLSLRVSNTGPEPNESGTLGTTRPRLLLSLLSRFRIRYGASSVGLEPKALTEAEFVDFARYVLYDPERTTPVIVLTPHQEGTFEIEPSAFGREFVTLGELYVAATPGATFALTDEVGKRLSCFRGALRAYLPGLNRNPDPLRHPLLLPHRLRDKDDRYRLAQYLALLTVRRHGDDPTIAHLRDERAVRLEERRKSIVASLSYSRAEAEREAKDWYEVAEELTKENADLKGAVKGLQRELEGLNDRLEEANHKSAALLYLLEQRRAVATSAEAEDEDRLPPASVLEAVETAGASFAEDLHFLKSAFATARESPFERPVDVFRLLEAMGEIASKMRGGTLGRNLKDAFAEKGVEYAQGISESTPKRLRRQYEFADGDRVYFCGEHLKLGNSYDAGESLRIYFSSKNGPERRWVVGHVGRHLDTMTTT